MNNRIKKLRQQSLEAKPTLSPERARLMTEFYESDICFSVSAPVRRALSFKYMLENKKICINPGELIVGERGPAPKATPTYPEITAHSEQDLEILNSVERIGDPCPSMRSPELDIADLENTRVYEQVHYVAYSRPLLDQREEAVVGLGRLDSRQVFREGEVSRLGCQHYSPLFGAGFDVFLKIHQFAEEEGRRLGGS